MPDPRLVAKRLTARGLPLGPLAEPFDYYATPHGKLHTSRTCRRITKATRSRIEVRTVTLSTLNAAQLCAGCASQGPVQVRAHVEWTGHVTKALDVLADCGQRSPYSSFYDVAAGTGATRVPGWHTIADLDDAARGLDPRWYPNRAEPEPELRVIFDDVLAHLAATRARIVAALEASGGDCGKTHLVALTKYDPARLCSSADRELYARTDAVAEPPLAYAYAYAPAPVADRLHAHRRGFTLGPAEAGDTRDVLATALRIAHTEPHPGLSGFTESALVRFLEAARGIHAHTVRDCGQL